jgi:MoaA/NifB/PqqE/SkfB family radical SAM enzyme
MIGAKIDNITTVTDEWKQAELPPPPAVKIEITSRCNLQCAFCGSKDRINKQDMDWPLYTQIIDELVELGVSEVGLFYLGEPFLYRNLPRAIEYAKMKKIEYVFLTTNGILADASRVESVMCAGLDSLKFSLNYYSPEQFYEVTGAKQSKFFDITANLKGAYRVRKESGYQCGLYASYIAYTGDQKEKMQEIIDECKPYVDEMYGLPLYNQAGVTNQDKDKLQWNFIGGNTGRIENPRPPLPCWAAFREAHITSAGDMSVCCFDHGDKYNMGNLKIKTFMQCWNDPDFVALRQAQLDRQIAGTVCEPCLTGG